VERRKTRSCDKMILIVGKRFLKRKHKQGGGGWLKLKLDVPQKRIQTPAKGKVPRGPAPGASLGGLFAGGWENPGGGLESWGKKFSTDRSQPAQRGLPGENNAKHWKVAWDLVARGGAQGCRPKNCLKKKGSKRGGIRRTEESRSKRNLNNRQIYTWKPYFKRGSPGGGGKRRTKGAGQMGVRHDLWKNIGNNGRGAERVRKKENHGRNFT